jgi:hypothetical protein
MRLIDNVKDAWKFFSMQAMAAAVSLQAIWVALPDDLRESVPQNIVQWITIAIIVSGMVGRVVSQSKNDAQDH